MKFFTRKWVYCCFIFKIIGNLNQIPDSDDELSPETHKKSLEKLKNTDPDFYNFLEENDENLLNFDVDSGDDASEKGDDDDEDDKVHKPGPLQGDSDESDFEVRIKTRRDLLSRFIQYLKF